MQYLQLGKNRFAFAMKDTFYKFYDTWRYLIDYFKSDEALFTIFSQSETKALMTPCYVFWGKLAVYDILKQFKVKREEVFAMLYTSALNSVLSLSSKTIKRMMKKEKETAWVDQ